MKKPPIQICPHCGGGTAAIRERYSGVKDIYIDLETGEIDSTELHTGARYSYVRKYAVCADCGKRLYELTTENECSKGAGL